MYFNTLSPTNKQKKIFCLGSIICITLSKSQISYLYYVHIMLCYRSLDLAIDFVNGRTN